MYCKVHKFEKRIISKFESVMDYLFQTITVFGMLASEAPVISGDVPLCIRWNAMLVV